MKCVRSRRSSSRSAVPHLPVQRERKLTESGKDENHFQSHQKMGMRKRWGRCVFSTTK
jgi:hypothetical protein